MRSRQADSVRMETAAQTVVHSNTKIKETREKRNKNHLPAHVAVPGSDSARAGKEEATVP